MRRNSPVSQVIETRADSGTCMSPAGLGYRLNLYENGRSTQAKYQ
ncbi:hypothetical protein OOU_Y34scaffold00516g111 [Pyricularia oryzae Y34]|uniref:Uncharacterized protein n=3 Tax=Pyricularia oryzae TaxID=318829 RepID=A0A4P7NAI3_PYROR|nr:hypothetical protein OOU_Y34scaffold00516g111 [Pyricularia oryzae Y34]QBZ59583.1 hypothetical protein PoMZ_04544 [Pyricularia oryzae]